MARPAPTSRPSPGRRTARLFLLNLLIFGGAMVLLWGGSKLLHRPQGPSATVPMPADMVAGQAPAALDSGAYRLRVESARWVRQSSLPEGLRLSYRTRPNVLVDYLVVRVSVEDRGQKALPLTYLGSEQDVRFVLGSNDPSTSYTEPVPPADAATISGDAPLASGALAAGERRTGVLVYAVEPFRKGFELLLIPHYRSGVSPEGGPTQPALALRFAPAR